MFDYTVNMSTTSPPPSAVWRAQFDRVRAYVNEHDGRLPLNRDPDPDVAALGTWWMAQKLIAGRQRRDAAELAELGERLEPGTPAAVVLAALGDLTVQQLADLSAMLAAARRPKLTGEQLSQLDTLAADAWFARLRAARAYAQDHGGRMPTTRDPDPDLAALGSWWVQQSIALTRAKLTAQQIEQLDQVIAFVKQLDEQAGERRRANSIALVTERAHDRAARAGRVAAESARKALGSPHLLPGDAEVLQLRIDHPEATNAALAELAGTTLSGFVAKFRGALNRTAQSSSPLPKRAADRLYEPGEAARLVGVPSKIIGRWESAGLVRAETTGRGARRYRGAELLRIKELIQGGWPAEFQEAAKPRRGRVSH